MTFLLLLACSTSEPVAPNPAPPPARPAPARSASSTPAPDELADTVRIGWQTTWATQGQLAAVLQKRPEILAAHGLRGTFRGFTYGGPLNEGALAGEVDALFTADQPALVLHGRAPSWGIVARLMYNRVGTFAAADGPIRSLADLGGKKVAVPFGAAAQRETLAAAKAAGATPNLVNVGVDEIATMASAGRWGDIAAAGAWDPTFATLEKSGKVRTLHTGTVTAVVVMDDAYVSLHQGADRRFVEAVKDGWAYVAAHRAEADGWFQELAKVQFAPGVLDAAAAVEPNLSGPVRTTLSDDDVAALERAATFLAEAKLTPTKVAVTGALRPTAR